MDIVSIDCGYDLPYFDLVLAQFVRNKTICLFMINPPRDFLKSVVYRTFDEALQVVRSSACLLFIQEPALFRRIDCGTSEAICGVLRCSGLNYGVIATYHHDYFGDTINVLQCVLPVIYTVLRCFLAGEPDSGGCLVEPCDDVYILGGLSCRSLPVVPGYNLPSSALAFTTGFPSVLRASQVVQISCGFSPFYFDWDTSEMLLPFSCLLNRSIRERTLKTVLDSFSERRNYFLRSEKLSDIQLDPISFPEFIYSVYDSACFDRWRNIPELLNMTQDDTKIYFCGLWMQRITLAGDPGGILEICSHELPTTCSSLFRETFSVFSRKAKFRVHEGRTLKPVYPVSRNLVKETDRFGTFLAFVSQELKVGARPAVDMASRFVVFTVNVGWFRSWVIKVCRFCFSFGPATVPNPVCYLGLDHEVSAICEAERVD